MSSEQQRWENYVVAQTAQALLGLVSPRLRAVAVQTDADREQVLLYFAMSECEDEDREDVSDVAFELDVLLEGHTRIGTDIYVGSDLAQWPGRGKRLVFRAKG